MNKTILTLAAALALTTTAAQAQSITHIARYPSETVSLTDMPCQAPGRSWTKTAIHVAYSPERGNSYGCYRMVGSKVAIDWYEVANRRALPDDVPLKDFVDARR